MFDPFYDNILYSVLFLQVLTEVFQPKKMAHLVTT